MMRTTGQLQNLTDQVFAVQDDNELFCNPGMGLLDLLTGWENPLPDLESYWIPIEGKNGQFADDQNGSHLMKLPQEIFLYIVEFCGNYEDVLRLSFTCRKAVGKLGPLATRVRNKLQRLVCDSTTYPNRPWNGKRVTWTFSGRSQQDPAFLEHVRSNILVAAKKRGRDEKDSSVSRSLRLLEDVHLMRREAEEGTEGLGSSLPSDVFRRTIVEAVRPRWYLPYDTTLDHKTHYIGEPPALEEYFWYTRRSDVLTAYHKLQRDVDPLSGGMSHYVDIVTKDRHLKRCAVEQRDCLRRNRDLTGDGLRRRMRNTRRRPYRIVNLDTLEHMDSTTVQSHFPKVRFWSEDTPTFVLWVHVCYSPDNFLTARGGRTETEEFGKGRWAGHRLRYETAEIEGERDRLCTTDVTLDMISLAVAVQKASQSYRRQRMGCFD
jgi:hypothetical protein